jgi:hypothetical protein
MTPQNPEDLLFRIFHALINHLGDSGNFDASIFSKVFFHFCRNKLSVGIENKKEGKIKEKGSSKKTN